MKNVFNVVIVVAFSFIYSGLAYGWNGWVPINVGCTNAWSGTGTGRPELENPKDLANGGHLLSDDEEALIRYMDENVYTISEPTPPTDYAWLMVAFADDGPGWEVESAYASWSFWVDVKHTEGGREENKFFYWDGVEQRFIQLDSCGAGDESGNEVNVWVAFENNGDEDNVTFLITGYTPYVDETWAKCNVAAVDLCVPHE